MLSGEIAQEKLRHQRFLLRGHQLNVGRAGDRESWDVLLPGSVALGMNMPVLPPVAIGHRLNAPFRYLINLQ
jgi:hypothetical protein